MTSGGSKCNLYPANSQALERLGYREGTLDHLSSVPLLCFCFCWICSNSEAANEGGDVLNVVTKDLMLVHSLEGPFDFLSAYLDLPSLYLKPFHRL
jgi:hypothetical protein